LLLQALILTVVLAAATDLEKGDAMQCRDARERERERERTAQKRKRVFLFSETRIIFLIQKKIDRAKLGHVPRLARL
jgi:hypothetical protein